MQKRLSSESGIAIGVILFALALIAVISVAMSAGSNFSGSTIAVDRIKMEVKSQAMLITTKIRECYTNGYNGKVSDCENNTQISPGVWSRSGCSPIDKSAYYPASDAAGTSVENITCPSYGTGAQNLWTGQSPAMLPPTPTGLNSWKYINAGDSGGRCIRIEPTTDRLTDAAVKQGLLEASGSYSSQELTYAPAGASQRFIIWITQPQGTVSVHCSS